MRRALQDLIGEQARFAGIVPRHAHLGGDIAQDLGHRIARRIDLLHGGQPHVQQFRQQGPVDVVLGRKIIKHVRLGQSGRPRDLVDRRPAKPFAEKTFNAPSMIRSRFFC
ncbi:hypothetical protein MGSAQ_000461 [marine sediment metagenome]|uniref:Uncharacterized protein n=1 Tax=marine sediment metagenome TaxID=412755 RepID=A0A1B6NXB4_9ZZZZ